MAADSIVLDSRALSALAEKSPQLRAALAAAVAAGTTIVVPTAVVAEATSGAGPRDALVNAFLKGCTIADLDEATARAAAALRHALRRRAAGTIDAIVVATADRRGRAAILTGDRDDLNALAAVRSRSRVFAIP